MLMGDACKLLDVENLTARVGDGLSKQCLGIGTERLVDFFLASFLRDEGALDAEFLQRNTKEVVGATIDLVAGNDMVASLADVEDGIEIGCLTRRGQYGTDTTFEGCNLLSHSVVGGVSQTGVEVAILLQVEEVGHLLCIVILERGALDDREYARFTILGLPACLYAECGGFEFLCHC